MRPSTHAPRPTERPTATTRASLLAVALLCAAPCAAHAQDAVRGPAPAAAVERPSAGTVRAPGAPRRPLDLSVAVRGGTLGYGAEVGKLVAGHLGVRVAAYQFNYARTQDYDEVNYDARLKLRSASALVDVFPGRRGRFHVTGGVVAGTTDVTGTGLPNGDTYDLNGTEYSSAQVGTLTARVRFPRTRPYAGLGWGTPAKNGGALGFSTDLGVVIGRPSLVMDATGAASDPQLRGDLEAKRVDTQETLDQYARFYPVLNFGITYRF